ncbi:MAG: hypothetical protein Q9201_003864 [Fulgogasparrea decipioides]
MAIPTRPAAMATPPAMTAMCPDVADDAGASPFWTASDAEELAAAAWELAEADTELKDADTELKEAKTDDGNGLATLTSLVYISTTCSPTLDQNCWAGVGIAVNQSGRSSDEAWAKEAKNSSGSAAWDATTDVGMAVTTAEKASE